MKTYNIACVWQMYGKTEVEAETLEEAILIAESPEFGLPSNSEYLEESFKVDLDGCEEINYDE